MSRKDLVEVAAVMAVTARRTALRKTGRINSSALFLGPGMKLRAGIIALALLAIGLWHVSASATVVVLSDSFIRSPAGTPVGTPPDKDTSAAAQANAAANWVSSWGANNNAAGGYVNQTYTTFVTASGTDYFVDGTNGISGNWLNNGLASYPLKLANVATTTTEPIGIPGFAWVQINHNFAGDSVVTNSGKITVSFDLYRTPGGNISWFFGQDDSTGVNNGNNGSPATIAANDISIYWRGTQAASFGVRDNGSTAPPGFGGASSDVISYIGSPSLSIPIPIQIDITGTNFTSGQNSLIEMWVAGVQQDLNGTNAGLGLTFSWDAGAAAYMGFGSNNTPVEGTVAAPVYRASGIDNLRITVVPEPSSVVILSLAALGALTRRRWRI